MLTFRQFIENDADHQQALNQTGFWGKQGAGCIIVARGTGKILMPLRSRYVLEPNTWGTWGGAIDSQEIPAEAAKREVQEEAGYTGNVETIPLKVFQKNQFKYHNFLAIVDSEFTPTLNWETQEAIWTDLDKIHELPQSLHFGLKWILDNDGEKIRTIIENLKNQ